MVDQLQCEVYTGVDGMTWLKFPDMPAFCVVYCIQEDGKCDVVPARVVLRGFEQMEKASEKRALLRVINALRECPEVVETAALVKQLSMVGD